MNNSRLASAPLSAKLLVTSILCVIGLVYLTLVVHIWIDTDLKPSLVAESYGYMEYIELTDHAHFYFPYYAFLLGIPVALFMFTSYKEMWKIFFAVVPFCVIIVDISSMYLIPYVWAIGFAWVLWMAGTCLGTMLFILYLAILYDVWLKKA